MKPDLLESFEKCKKTIDSCKTLEEALLADNMVENFKQYYPRWDEKYRLYAIELDYLVLQKFSSFEVISNLKNKNNGK